MKKSVEVELFRLSELRRNVRSSIPIRRYCEKMAKLILFIFVALLATSLIMAAPDKSSNCGRHGDPCDKGCCENLRCHVYANRCQVVITEADLMAQREKILGRKGKDY